MKKYIVYFFLQITLNIVFAQCGFEHEYKTGYNVGKFKVLEGPSSSSYSFYGSSIDTSDPTGQSNKQIWIIKHDSCGNLVWQKNYGFNDVSLDDFSDVVTDNDSGFLVVGHGEGVDQGSLYSFTLFRIDKEGILLWKKAYGGKHPTVANSISYNAITNSYFIAGKIERKQNALNNRPYILEVDTAGNVIREKDLIINNDSTRSGNAVYGVFPLPDSTLLALVALDFEDSIYLVKLDNQMNILWERKPFAKEYENVRFYDRFVYDYKNNKLALMQQATLKKNKIEEYIFLFEIDTSGEIISTTNIEKDRPRGGTLTVSLANDGGYILGYPFLKVNKNLEEEWQKFLSDSITLHSIIQTQNGSYVLLGEKYHEDAQGNGYEKLYIQQTDRRGWMVNIPEKVNKKEETKITLYPNPSNGIFALSNITNQIYTATITNTLGSTRQLPVNQNQLDLSQEPAGMYWVTLSNAQGEIKLTQKVVLSK